MLVDASNLEVYQQWDDGFIIRRMREDEGQQVIKWFSPRRTMSSDVEVALSVHNKDTGSFYVGELNGKMVASTLEIPVADDVRYIGCVYVDEQNRKLGFARRMLTTARDISDCRYNASIIALDTRPYLESLYEKFDYKTVCKSADYQGVVSACVDGFGTEVRQV